MNEEVKQIMLGKLKEMSEINMDNNICNYNEYSVICRTMNEIAKTLTEISAREEFVRNMTENEDEIED